MRFKFLVTSILAIVTSASTVAACPITRATYVPVSPDTVGVKANYEITHRPRKDETGQGRNIMTLRDALSQKSFDYSYAFTNGYGRTALVFLGETGKPLEEAGKPEGEATDAFDGPGSHILFFDQRLRTVNPEGDETKAAPAYLIAPELGVNFWYWAKGDRKFVPPPGLWRLAKCR
jgi:hypothetical protein